VAAGLKGGFDASKGDITRYLYQVNQKPWAAVRKEVTLLSCNHFRRTTMSINTDLDDGYAALMEDVRAGKAGGPRAVVFDTFPWTESQDAAALTGVAVGMIYQKSPRESSRRWITIRSVTAEAPQKLTAYCWLRRAVKTFRLDKIQGLYDVDGVVVDPHPFFAAFGVRIDDLVAPVPSAICRISLSLPFGLLRQIDAVAEDRNRFVVEAIKAALPQEA